MVGDGIELGAVLGAVVGAIGEATGLLVIAGGAVDRVPNQFHCVKPKNNRISTTQMRSATRVQNPSIRYRASNAPSL